MNDPSVLAALRADGGPLTPASPGVRVPQSFRALCAAAPSGPDARFEASYALFYPGESFDAHRPLVGRDGYQPIEPLSQRFARHAHFVSNGIEPFVHFAPKRIEPLALQDENIGDVNDRTFEPLEPGHRVS